MAALDAHLVDAVFPTGSAFCDCGRCPRAYRIYLRGKMRVFGPLARCFGALALATVTTSAAAPRLDPAFGTAGVVTTDFGYPVEIGALLPKRDGSIVVVGTDTDLGDALVLRYGADSILQGRASFDVHEGLDYVDTVAEQADGMLLVAGRTCDLLDPARTCAAFVARFGADGRLDPGF